MLCYYVSAMTPSDSMGFDQAPFSQALNETTRKALSLLARAWLSSLWARSAEAAQAHEVVAL
eukprot:7253024-Heterocapsa_arctica.AAC.1